MLAKSAGGADFEVFPSGNAKENVAKFTGDADLEVFP